MLSLGRRLATVGTRFLTAEVRFYGTSNGLPTVAVKMGEPAIVNRCTSFKKSLKDTREYRGLVLKNRLQVLLVSDPTADMAAASMDVAVGHLHDPWDMPGTAHFCEHMLFLGTEKYPSENEYSKFLSANAGTSNAFTSSDHTNYHFDVKPDQLFPALDRFAQFFLTPQFTESATGKEVLAVDSEHQNNLKNDAWRILQVGRYLSKPGHDNGKFGTGDKNTLGDLAVAKGLNPREVLLDFHRKWYSSNIMRLVIVGKEPLDTLEDYVVQLELDKIPDKDVEKTFWNDHPLGDEQLKKRVDIIPIKDNRMLKVCFPAPYLEHEYKSQPDHIVSHLLGHEGEGSLLALLKAKGWVSSLSAGSSALARGISSFNICVDLSEAGLDHVDDVVEMMFRYIGLIKREAPQKWIYDELREIGEMKFTFKDKVSPYNLATNTATALQRIPFEDILSYSLLMPEYKPELCRKLIDCLRPDNMYIEVIAQGNRERKSSSPMTKEPIYGTDIRIECLPTETLQRFYTAMETPSSHLHIPKKNEYIPTKFGLKPRELDATGYPQLIHTDPYTYIWFRQDNEFKMPKMHIKANVFSPVLGNCPRSSFISTLWLYAYHDSLSEQTYNATIAGMKFHVDFGTDSFSIETSGYDEKQPNFMKDLIASLVTFEPEQGRFEVLLDNYVRSLDNFEHNQPHSISQEYLNLLLVETKWSKKQIREAGANITLEDLRAHKQKLLETFHVELFAHGNVTKQEALQLGKDINQLMQNVTWTHRPLYHNETSLKKELAIDCGVPMIYRHFQATHQNSAVEALFQIGVHNDKDNALLLLLLQILRESAFNTLRTNEQLGYIVWTGPRVSAGTIGFEVIVQGSADPDYVMSRIEAFLENERQTIVDMSEETLKGEIEAVVTKLLEKPKTLAEKHRRLWMEIETRYYNFDKREIQADLLKNVSKSDILNFFDQKLKKDSPERRLVSIYVHGNADQKEVVNEKVKNAEIKHDYNEIECMEATRNHLSVFARPKPKMFVPPMGKDPIN